MHSAFEERRRGCKNLSGDVGDDLWQQLRDSNNDRRKFRSQTSDNMDR